MALLGGGVERERYLKQRFPSVSMCKSDIVCCKQCDGYGMADDFIDKNFCSEKCRKLGQARASLAKSLANVVKVTVKRKSAAAAAEAAAEAVSDRSAISGDPLKEAEARVWILFLFLAQFNIICHVFFLLRPLKFNYYYLFKT